MLLENLAKELVEFTSGLVGGRTINVMNTNGIIIASTEPHRIGTFHQGALECIQTGKPVSISKEQLDRYPGAKQGYNMPLRVNGRIIGVVGIFGNPPEIEYLARLLEVYAAKFYQLEAMAIPRLADGELRSRLLRGLLAPSNASSSDVQMLMESLRFHPEFPITVAVISSLSGAMLASNQDMLASWLAAHNLLRPERDIWGIEDDRFVLLHSGSGLTDIFLKPETADFRSMYRISIGIPCHSLWRIHEAYEQAVILDVSSAAPVNDMTNVSTRCQYLLRHTAADEADFLDALYEKLTATFRKSELATLLTTLETYYACNRSVAQAAESLFIHKNTLQYRVRRVLETLDLIGQADFQQEYICRLLLEHYKRKQGLRALK